MALIYHHNPLFLYRLVQESTVFKDEAPFIQINAAQWRMKPKWIFPVVQPVERTDRDCRSDFRVSQLPVSLPAKLNRNRMI